MLISVNHVKKLYYFTDIRFSIMWGFVSYKLLVKDKIDTFMRFKRQRGGAHVYAYRITAVFKSNNVFV